MKVVLSSILVGLTLSGCSNFSPKIADNHLRFENFRRLQNYDVELVYLMCENHRPVSWTSPKQFTSGEHDLWVKAKFGDIERMSSAKEAIVNFKVNLDEGKAYMLNRNVKADTVSLWIQESETGLVVSEVITEKLELPNFVGNLREKQCESGTV
ncbi:hypothetical protein [Paraglaciecola sp. 2405UD69-4]|uniref:hypothetical protein n=1 Tax=Paraglaciecola sp. 2405UD69-4 TaxID=3391836 RepID=UPI0039C9071D